MCIRDSPQPLFPSGWHFISLLITSSSFIPCPAQPSYRNWHHNIRQSIQLIDLSVVPYSPLSTSQVFSFQGKVLTMYVVMCFLGRFDATVHVKRFARSVWVRVSVFALPIICRIIISHTQTFASCTGTINYLETEKSPRCLTRRIVFGNSIFITRYILSLIHI